MKTKIFATILFLSCFFKIQAQKNIINEQLSDSFLDSLSNYFENNSFKNHFLSARFGYSNKALFAGRDYGINQSMMIPSLTYFHKSGIYSEISGFAYSQSEPKYQFTNIAAGYIGTLDKFTYFAEYSRSFSASKEVPNTLSNMFSGYGSYTYKKFNASVSYSFLFDNNSTSHLVVPSIGMNFSTKKVGFIDRITFSPSINTTFGSNNSFLNNFNPFPNPSGSGNPFANGNMGATSPWGSGPPPWVKADTSGTLQRPAWLNNTQNGENPTQQTNSKFGLMAVALSSPVSVKVKNYTFSFTPSLTKPIALTSSEMVSKRPLFNFSVGVSYNLGWK